MVISKKYKIKLDKSDTIFLIAILSIAFLLRLFLLRYRFVINFDAVNYLKLAASGNMLGLSHVFHSYWSPFYPLVVALFLKISNNIELVGRLVSIVSGTLVMIPMYLYSRHYFGTRTAKITTVLFGLFPALAFLNTRAQTESLYILIITSAIFIGWVVLKRKSISLAFANGVLFGFAYLTKPEGMGFLLVFCGILGLVFIYDVIKKQKWHHWIVIGLLTVTGFLVASSPYLLFLKKHTGEWTISAKGKANQQFEALATGLAKDVKIKDPFRSLSDDNKHVKIDQIYHIGSFLKAERQSGSPTVKVNPIILVRKYIENFYKVVSNGLSHALTSVILIFMVIGLFGKSWNRETALRELYLLSYVLFFWFVVVPLFHINDRYFIPLIAIVFIWAGKGFLIFIEWIEATLQEIWSGHRKLSNQSLAKIIAVIFMAGVLYLPQLGKILVRSPWDSNYWSEPMEQKIAGKWLKEYFDKTPVIMSRGHAVDFYAGNYNIAESVTVPRNEISRVVEYAKFRGVDVIVLNERYLIAYPQLSHLLNEENIPESLELIYKYDKKPGLKTVVYKVK